MEYKDYYKVLGVERQASADQIKKRYRKLVVQFHPDKNQGNAAAEERFKEINEAYLVLGNPEKRKKYDDLGVNWNQYQQQGFGGFQHRSNAGSQQGFDDFFGSSSGFSDFFDAFFSGGFGAQSSGSRQHQKRRIRGEDLSASISLTLQQAYSGVEQLINLNGQRLKIRIKPGVKDGQTMRIKGKGQVSPMGGEPGDLLLKVQVQQMKGITRDGDDLIADFPIDIYTAALGGKLPFHSFKGVVQVPVKAGQQNGSILRLKGLGMPVYAGSSYGNLFLKVQLQLPEELSKAELDLLRQAASLRAK